LVEATMRAWPPGARRGLVICIIFGNIQLFANFGRIAIALRVVMGYNVVVEGRSTDRFGRYDRGFFICRLWREPSFSACIHGRTKAIIDFTVARRQN
jgi:hypothetical protein